MKPIVLRIHCRELFGWLVCHVILKTILSVHAVLGSFVKTLHGLCVDRVLIVLVQVLLPVNS